MVRRPWLLDDRRPTAAKLKRRTLLTLIRRVSLAQRFSRETLLSRTGYSPARVAVIPNAVDTTLFRPALALRSASPTVVVISRYAKEPKKEGGTAGWEVNVARLAAPHPAPCTPCPSTPLYCSLYWRKGIDLLAELIPLVCRAHPTVRFLVGGDGPKKRVLERMCAEHQVGSARG